MPAEIIANKLHLDGYIYYKSRVRNEKTYWDCRKTKRKECTARAVTIVNVSDGNIEVLKGPTDSSHSHPPDREEVAAEKLIQGIKRKAATQPELRPAQLLRCELQGTSGAVLSQMPEQTALLRTVRRVRSKNSIPNPKSLADLGELPADYQKTLLGEQFLMYDSLTDAHDDRDTDDEEEEGLSNDEEEQQPRRVLVFATRRNIEILCTSTVWFVDGTFKTAPSIFTQIFTVMGLRTRAGGSGEAVAIPLVYALLSSKKKSIYIEALEVISNAVNQYRIDPCIPSKIMADFEVGIINACKTVFPAVPVSGCFFHLCQSIYRRVQGEGLQAAYNDENDRSLKLHTHMLMSLAFVPPADVVHAYIELRRECPAALLPVYDYFDRNYIRGVTRRGNRRAVRPRFEPGLWNQYETAVAKSHRTNNVSEAWHNRFQSIVGRHHPDIYTTISQFQQEQGYSEICVTELSLGKRVKDAPPKKWRDLQTRLESISAEYPNLPVIQYLRTLSHNVTL